MSEQNKVWFVYLTDHHEGPFTPEEVAAKAQEGVVTGATLGWKDGMAEWVAVDSIPELSAALSAGAAAPASASAPAELTPSPMTTSMPAEEIPAENPVAETSGGSSFSLAQMLADQQQGGGSTGETDGGFVGGADALASLTASAQSSAGDKTPVGGTPMPMGGSASGGDPAPHEDAWTLRVGSQVTGLHSLNQLKTMAIAGELPPNAEVWHRGWTDFQPLSALPEVNSVRAARRSGTTSATGSLRRPMSGLAPITAGANVGEDEPTDTGIQAPQSGLKHLLARALDPVLSRFGKGAPKPKVIRHTTTITKIPAGRVTKPAGGGGAIKRIGAVLAVVALVAGGGFAYLKFFASPLPRDLDVLPDDLELMTEVAKVPATEGGKFYVATARGEGENPADETTPKFYVATNLPAGTAVTLHLSGKPGTLVNRVSFEKDYTAQVGSHKLAVFERIDDDGKPVPMGSYSVKVSAAGATPDVKDRFLGGKKGAVYQDRLKKYKDKLQADYDQEVSELRELVETLKQLSADVAKKLAEHRAAPATPAARAKMAADWRSFTPTETSLLTQVDQKVKARAANGGPAYHQRAFDDVAGIAAKLTQLLAAEGEHLEGKTPSANPDELSAAVQAGLSGLEALLAQAVVKGPFDVAPAPAAAPAPAPAEGAPAPAAGAAPEALPAATPPSAE